MNINHEQKTTKSTSKIMNINPEQKTHKKDHE